MEALHFSAMNSPRPSGIWFQSSSGVMPVNKALQDNANRNDDGLSYPDLARRQEILLDALVHEATIKQGNKFLLSERFAPLLSESEQRLKEILLNARQEILNIPGYDLLSASRAVEDMYVNLGCRAVNII